MSAIMCQCGQPLMRDGCVLAHPLHLDGRGRCPRCRRYWKLPLRVSTLVAEGAIVHMQESSTLVHMQLTRIR